MRGFRPLMEAGSFPLRRFGGACSEEAPETSGDPGAPPRLSGLRGTTADSRKRPPKKEKRKKRDNPKIIQIFAGSNYSNT